MFSRLVAQVLTQRLGQTAVVELDVVPLRVAIWDDKQRYPVPLHFSPWGYMTYSHPERNLRRCFWADPSQQHRLD